jgi:E3 ubiquitin-protein ligase DOA10
MPFLSNPFEHLGPNRLDQHRPDLENIRWGYDNIDDHRENEDTHRWEFTHNEHRFNHLDMDDLRPAERQPEPEIPAPAPQQQAPVNPPAPQNQVDDEEPFDVADDINGVLEAIGMRGNLWLLFQNSILMALMISMCLSVAVWIPYVIGRVVIMVCCYKYTNMRTTLILILSLDSTCKYH